MAEAAERVAVLMVTLETMAGVKADEKAVAVEKVVPKVARVVASTVALTGAKEATAVVVRVPEQPSRSSLGAKSIQLTHQGSSRALTPGARSRHPLQTGPPRRHCNRCSRQL